jgi:uncharacterized membrane protein YoaK (UPF0700 family)
MLSHEGHHRSDRHNRWLAGNLALVAGYVNASGFALIGTFTSHVTGNVGRLSHNLARGETAAALLAIAMIAAFFLGAFLASMAIESSLFGHRAHVYGALLLAEAGLLLAFFAVARLLPSRQAHVQDAQALVLCAAMGLQNSLVTRLSGAIVRTTHLTGVVTDLGIEAARWFRYARHSVGTRSGFKLTFTAAPPTRPHGPKVALLATIFFSFCAGSGLGAVLVYRFRHLTLLVPAIGLVVFGLISVRASSDLVDDEGRGGDDAALSGG